MLQLQQILIAVEEGANARAADLLPMVMKKIAIGNMGCHRHDNLWLPRVEAEIKLTRAKRVYNHDLWLWSRLNCSEEQAYESMLKAVTYRDMLRTEYRATPCTCWDPKR